MLSYRKELDGLRAISVIAVIIYHADIELFGIKFMPGGFLGVDVFFVLSGYLITQIIRSQIETGSFSILSFYWSRAKRIIPALALVLLVSTALAYFLLLPSDLITYSRSLQSALYFGSNYFFYGEDSYVSDASVFKPLLHTWSLAVEWQFYIVYPVFLCFLYAFFKRCVFVVLFLLTLTSFSYSSFMSPNYPDMTFYLLPSRVWELVLGGLLSFLDINRIFQGRQSYFLSKFLAFFGVTLIIAGFVIFDHGINHPSFSTLVPILGVCLFIVFSSDSRQSRIFLSSKVLVYVGTLSYSLYLWHQPIFAFFRIRYGELLSLSEFLFLLSISILLSVLTYHSVENYFRKTSKARLSIGLLLVSFGALSIFGYLCTLNEGFPQRLSGLKKDAYEMYRTVEYRRLKSTPSGVNHTGSVIDVCTQRTPKTACKFGNQKWLTIGDSYVGQLEYALVRRLELLGDGMISLSHEQCPFVSSQIWFGSMPTCTLANEERWAVIQALSSPRNIILAANYNSFSKSKEKTQNPVKDRMNGFSGGDFLDDDLAWKSYADNVDRLLELGHTVYVIYPVPNPGFDIKKAVFKQLMVDAYQLKNTWSNDPEALSKVEIISTKLDEYLSEHPNLHKIYPEQAFCDLEKCKVIDIHGGFYNNGRHLSNAGANKVLDLIFD